MLLTKKFIIVLKINLVLIIMLQMSGQLCQEELKNSVCFGERTCIYKKTLLCSHKNITFINLNCKQSELLLVLDYNHNNIAYINENTFENATNVQSLYLNNNEINKLGEFTFSSLKNIQDLHLLNNKIEKMHKHVFSNLFTLRFVDLENNELTLIEEETFKDCNYLWQLHLTNNNIKKIHKNSFKNNCSLVHLYCSHNQIEDIEFLKDLPNLVFLDLSYNNIQEIPITVFLQTKDLKKLNLSYNRLEVLYTGTFNHLSLLTDLNLSGNKLKKLGEGPFDNLYHLNCLDIRNNCINLFSFDNNFGMLRNNVVLKIFVDNNDWLCDYIYKIKNLPGIKLIYANVNKSVSNIEGIPCRDRILYFKTASSTTVTINSIFEDQDIFNITPLNTTIIEVQTTEIYIEEMLNVTTVSVDDINSTVQQTTFFSVGTQIVQENTARPVILSTTEVDKSTLFIVGTVAVLLILIVLIVSFTFWKKCSSRQENEYFNDNYIKQDFSLRKSNFYITLDAYNEYEEVIEMDSEMEQDHIYEIID